MKKEDMTLLSCVIETTADGRRRAVINRDGVTTYLCGDTTAQVINSIFDELR